MGEPGFYGKGCCRSRNVYTFDAEDLLFVFFIFISCIAFALGKNLNLLLKENWKNHLLLHEGFIHRTLSSCNI